MSAHTPGPWRIEGGILKAGPNGVHLFDIRELAGQGKAAQANARLIAAAPDLLEACQALVAELYCLKWGRPYAGRPHALMDAAEAAIAKAEGRKP